MVDVAHEIVEVVNSIEANAGLRLESSEGLRQVVLLSKDYVIESKGWRIYGSGKERVRVE